MAHVSIIGTGTMGQAIASLVSKGGNTAELLGQSDAGKPVTGELVVLAVPYPALAGVLATRGDQLAGKVVVDITNPLNFETFDSLTVPADSSAAAGTVGGLPTTVLIAGDDAGAKAQAPCAAPANWRRWPSCRSPWPPRTRCPGPAASPSPPDTPGPGHLREGAAPDLSPAFIRAARSSPSRWHRGPPGRSTWPSANAPTGRCS